MKYGEVLQKSWHMLLRNKWFWLCGLVISLSNISGDGNFELFRRYFIQSWQGPMAAESVRVTVENIVAFFSRYMFSIIEMVERLRELDLWSTFPMFLVPMLLATLWPGLKLVVGTMGHIALLYSAWRADGGAGDLEPTDFRRLNRRHFWNVVGFFCFRWFIYILIMIPLLLVGVGYWKQATLILQDRDLLHFALLMMMQLTPLFVFFWFFEILWQLALVAVVTGQQTVFGALRSAWNIIRKKTSQVLSMGFFLELISLVPNIILAVPLLLAFVRMVTDAAYGGRWANDVSLVYVACYLGMYVPLMLLFNTPLVAYRYSAWTLTFRRLQNGEGKQPAGR